MSDAGGNGPTYRGWSLSARAAGDAVRLELGISEVEGRPVTAVITLEKAEARAFARALLAAAGDATERTFRPSRKR